MLSLLRGMKRGGGRMPFAERTVPLHAMTAWCGYEVQTSPAYDWHGLKRGNAELALIQYTIAGWGFLDWGGRRYRVGPGQAMLLCFPHDHRYWLPAESGRWEFLYAGVYGREILRIWQELIVRWGPVWEIPATAPAIRRLAALVRDVQAGTLRSVFESSFRAYELALRLMEWGMTRPAAATRPPALQRAIDHARDHFRATVGVDDLAAAAGFSRYHFSRLFKQSTGLAPGEYLLQLRLRHAARQLAESPLRVKEVARESGFADVNYFCRRFRKSYGVSPRQFRATVEPGVRAAAAPARPAANT